MSDPQDSTIYRTELTPGEEASLDPQNPARLIERVRIVVPESGRVDDAKVKVIYPDGEVDLINVMRVVISLEPTSCPPSDPYSKPGTAVAMITKWNQEIGKFQYMIADCVLNDPKPLIHRLN